MIFLLMTFIRRAIEIARLPVGRPQVTEFRRFELKTDLPSPPDVGNYATAYLRVANGVGKWLTDTETIFTVYDAMGMYEGTGRDSAGSGSGARGAYGYAQKFPDTTEWEIYQMECPAP